MLTLTQHTAPDSNYPKHRRYREVSANNQVGPSRLPRGGQPCWFPHHRAESLAQHHLRSLKVGVLLGRPLPPTNKRGAPAFSESLCGQADHRLHSHGQTVCTATHRAQGRPATEVPPTQPCLVPGILSCLCIHQALRREGCLHTVSAICPHTGKRPREMKGKLGSHLVSPNCMPLPSLS